MAGTYPESWEETCLISIQRIGESPQQFGAMTESVDISEPDYSGEGIPTVAGGRIWKQSAQEDGEITLEMYPVDAEILRGGIISSIDGDGTTIALTTSAAHGLQIGDTIRISNTTSYGTTASPVNYTIKTVPTVTTATMLSSTNAVEETNGTWVGFRGNTGLFQQFLGNPKSTAITTIDGDATSVTITSTAHGLQVGDIIEVAGTTNYNGIFVVTTRTSADIVVCTDDGHNVAADSTGTVTKIADGSHPIITATSFSAGIFNPRDKYMVAILWTDDTSAVNPTDATAGVDFTALRFYAKDSRIVSHKTAFTDGIVKTTATIKFPAMNKAGTERSYAWESTNDTDTQPLPALTYT
jgi:hypothetical protein